MPPSQSRRFASRGKGKAPEAEACPVCGSPLRVDWMVEEGPHGCRRVRLLRCPDDACPRSRLGEGAG